MIKAAEHGDVEAVKTLLRQDAAVSLKTGALLLAAMNGHAEIVRLLINNGADIADDAGSVAMVLAVMNDHADIVILLIEKGVDIDGRSEIDGGNTALIRAAISDRVEIARLLLEHGADLDITGSSGNTALACAVERGYPEMAQLLQDETDRRAEQKAVAAAAEEQQMLHTTATLKQQRLKEMSQRLKPKFGPAP